MPFMGNQNSATPPFRGQQPTFHGGPTPINRPAGMQTWRQKRTPVQDRLGHNKKFKKMQTRNQPSANTEPPPPGTTASGEEDLDRYETASSLDEDQLIPEPQQPATEGIKERKTPKFIENWMKIPPYKIALMKTIYYQTGRRGFIVKAYTDASQRVREDAILSGLIRKRS